MSQSSPITTASGRHATSFTRFTLASPAAEILAALPHLLFGALQFLFTGLDVDGLPGLGSLLFAAALTGFPLLIGIALVFAWWLKWPRWSASWYSYGVALSVYLLARLADGIGLTGLHDWLVEAAMGILLPLVVAYALYRITCADRFRGLLSALPVLASFWLLGGEMGPAGSPLASALVFCLVALVSVVVLRQNRLRAGLFTALLMHAGAGLLWYFSAAGLAPLSAQQAGDLLLHFLSGSTLVVGPLLAWRLREFGLDRGWPGREGYRLALTGLLLVVAGSLVANFSLTAEGLGSPVLGGLAFSGHLAILGGLVYLYGWRFLFGASRSAWALPGEQLWQAAGLFTLLACLPALLLLGLAQRPAFTGVTFAGASLQALSSGPWPLVLGGAWLVLTAALIVYSGPEE